MIKLITDVWHGEPRPSPKGPVMCGIHSAPTCKECRQAPTSGNTALQSKIYRSKHSSATVVVIIGVLIKCGSQHFIPHQQMPEADVHHFLQWPMELCTPSQPRHCLSSSAFSLTRALFTFCSRSGQVLALLGAPSVSPEHSSPWFSLVLMLWMVLF